MEKLSEIGKLYLKDYLVLDEAKKDMDRFLDTVIGKTEKILVKEFESLEPDGFAINVVERESKKGYMSVHYKCLESKKHFRKDSVVLRIIYRDVRLATDLTDPTCVKIYLDTPKVASEVEEKLREISQYRGDGNFYETKFVKLSLDDSKKSAEEIAAYILGKGEKIKRLFSEIERVAK